MPPGTLPAVDSTDSSNTERQTDTRIAVIGTGYVGLTTGACLAHLGNSVICVDIDEVKVERLRRGLIPIVEEGLDTVVAEAQSAGRLSFTTELAAAVPSADIVFLCVPTPQDEDGSADLSYVEGAARSIGPLLQPNAVVVNKSTVPVGSFHFVGEALGRDDVAVVSNPEFLREGSAVNDFFHPDRVVIGADDAEAAAKVRAVYGSIETEFILTDPASAETVKYAANGFLAMKISFINSVAAMCEQVGADVSSVIKGIGSDHRIGPAYLEPGPGLGWQLLPQGLSGARIDRCGARLRLLTHARRDRHQRTAIRAHGRQDRQRPRPVQPRPPLGQGRRRARSDVQGGHRRLA